MEQQLEFPARAATEPDQRLEPDNAAADAVLQHRPARDGPRPIRACRRAGRSGCGGVAVACALGKLSSRSRAYLHLPDCDIGVHWPRQVAGRTQCGGRLPHEGVLPWRVSPAMVVRQRAAWPGRHEPTQPPAHRRPQFLELFTNQTIATAKAKFRGLPGFLHLVLQKLFRFE